MIILGTLDPSQRREGSGIGTSYSMEEQDLYIPGAEASALGTFDLAMVLASVEDITQFQLESASASGFNSGNNSIALDAGILTLAQLDVPDGMGSITSYVIGPRIQPHSIQHSKHNPVKVVSWVVKYVHPQHWFYGPIVDGQSFTLPVAS